MKEYIAIDLGASNGRTILGSFDGRKLSLEVLNRFENNYVRVGDAYYWDILGLYSNIKAGLREYAKDSSVTLTGIGIDTWGVDFGLIDKQGRLVANPRAYRDPRGLRGMNALHQKYGEKTLFDLTGIANLEINTVYQLYDMVITDDPQLRIADKLLLVPDLLGYIMCGEISSEYTNASTTQMLDSATGTWSKKIADMVGIHASLLPRIQMSGTVKGTLHKFICEEAGITGTPTVYCVGSHDTASAVASVSAGNKNFSFISSGTWSLAGIISDTAIINDTAYDNKFSNEGTVDGIYRPLKNIMGLWIIQNCKRQWDREKKLSWDDIARMAEAAPAFRSLINVNAHGFFDGDNMSQKIQRYCKSTGQPVPETKGEIARTVYESLAMSYREAFVGLETLKGSRIDVMHIMGGGSKNRLLNQYTANAIDREVIAGPTEATAIGNLMIQVKASGEVKDSDEMQQVIRDSFDLESYEPYDINAWTEQFKKYLLIKQRYKETK